MSVWSWKTASLLATALTGVLFAFRPSGSAAPSRTALVWTSAPSMRHARAAHAVVATADAIYALAGTGADDGKPVLSVEKFDGIEWKEETTLPGEGLNAPAAVTMEGRVYVLGGFGTVTNVPIADVRVYNVKSKEWSSAAPLPAPRGGHAAAVLAGRIHVVGGGNSRSTLADHSVFDPSTDRWSELAPLPHAEGSPAAVVLDGKLYAIGGRGGSKDFGDVMVYDKDANSWSAGPVIEPRATCGAVVCRGSIFLIGGESQAKARVLAEVLRLPLGGLEWAAESPLPTARSFARSVVFRGSVYVVGGSLEPQSSHAPRGTAIVERSALGD